MHITLLFCGPSGERTHLSEDKIINEIEGGEDKSDSGRIKKTI